MGLAQFICFFLNCMKLTELERILLWTSLLFYPLGFLYISHFPWNSHLIPTLKSKRDPYLLILSTFCLSSCQLLWKEIKSIMYKVTIRVLECLLVLRIIGKQSQISKRPLSDQEDLIIWLAAQLVDSVIIKEKGFEELVASRSWRLKYIVITYLGGSCKMICTATILN